MKATLQPGLTHKFSFKVSDDKTVPALYPESAIFTGMPRVFATGYMVGLFEWACTELMANHLDAGEGSLGTHVDFSHEAATPPGMTVTVDAKVIAVEGSKVTFEVSGHDGIDRIGGGKHERFIVKWDKFNKRVEDKRAKALAGVA
jgi:fluoroacetyl-CoA thioesterase